MSRKLYWGVSLLFTFSLFYFAIPPAIYNGAPMILSILGAILFTFFLVQVIWDFKSFQSFNKPEPGESTSGNKFAPFMVIPGLIMIFVFYMGFCGRVTDEIKKFGVRTNATVEDGSSSVGRKSSSYDLEISFTTNTGQVINITKGVSQSEFKNTYKGEIIPIVYSSKHPELNELILSDESVKTYLGIENRPVALLDLYKLYDYSNADSITRYVNQISYKWTLEKDSGRYIWQSQNKDEIIITSFKKTLSLISKRYSDHEKLMEEMKNAGYKKISKSSDGTEIYENKEFRVGFKEKYMNEEGSLGLTIGFIMQIVKIN